MELIKNKGWRGAGIVAIALLFASGIALGQAQTGNIFAQAADDNGAALPGVSVTLTGVGAPVTQVTNVNGEVRFLNLAPGTYTLDFSLQGFSKVSRKNVTVAVAQNTQINVTMKLAGVQEAVVVTGESPLLDTRKTGSSATVDKVQLEDIPSARDPWVILQTAPGVQIDRVNVGGSESGQQSVYVGKGDNGFQGTWNVDGVNITDMGALGSSPAYYDFDSFAEIQISTGGSDVAIQTPGAQLNMVTKRGTNDVHGSARVLITDRKFQSTNISEELAAQLAQAGQTVQGNQIQNIQDYGAELGGPLWKDHLWLWGAYGRNQIDLLTAAGYPDRTKLEDLNFKLNAQIIPENTLTAVYNHNDKIKLGRNSGPQRPPETAWNQTGPGKIYKIEDSHIFSSDFFATASYSRVLGGFQFDTDGQDQAYRDENLVWHQGYYHYTTYRPQTQVNVLPSYFLRTGNVGHEFKAGFVYRTTPIGSTSSWPQGIIGFAPGAYNETQGIAGFTRDAVRQTEQKYYSGYLSDTLTIDKLTVNLGVRYDHQESWNAAVAVPCCRYDGAQWPQIPFTPLSVPESSKLTWDDWSPRVGLTYSLNQGKTLLKASYGRFVNQLGGGTSSWNSNAPIGTSYLYYYWNDANSNHHVDPGEVDFTGDYGYGPNGIYGGWYVDPNVPNPVTGLNVNDPNLKAPHTDEFILGVEHEVLPAFVVGLAGTYRKFTNYTGTQALSADGTRILTQADYTCTQVGPYPQTPGGTPVYVNQCNPNPGVASESRILTNVPDYNQQYWGVDLTATKRYSDKWMARMAFTWSDWKQHDTGAISDPSSLRPGAGNDIVGYGNIDGGIVVVSPGAISGAKAGVFINSRWAATVSGLYTLPLDFNISTSLFAREGYPVPYYRQLSARNVPAYATPKQYLLGNVSDVRLPSVFEWDLGLSKVVKVGPLDVTLMADVFNVLNRNTVLQRQNRVTGSVGAPSQADNDILEQQSPRIWRFGARLSF